MVGELDPRSLDHSVAVEQLWRVALHEPEREQMVDVATGDLRDVLARHWWAAQVEVSAEHERIAGRKRQRLGP